MLKIALVDPSVFTEDYDLALLTALRTVPGIQVDWYGSGKARSSLVEPFFFRPRPLHRGGQKGWVLPLKALWYLADLVRFYHRARRYRIVHFQWACIPLLDRLFIGALRRAGVKTVFTVHDPRPFNLAPSNKLQLFGWRGLLIAFDQLVVHTEQAREELRQLGVRAERCEVIPTGILRFPENNQHYRGTLPPDKVVILLFGALKPYKGLDLLLAAIAQLDEVLKARIHVVVVGRPYMSLEQHYAYCRAHELDRLVVWDPRFVDAGELDHLFRRADILCFPYREGDTSGVLMAAVHYGKAVVAAEIGAFAALLRHEQTALLFQVGDVESLANQLARAVEDADLRSRLGDNLRMSATAESWASVAARTAALYERLVEVKR